MSVYLDSLLDLDQVHIILNVVGSPTQEDLDSVTSEQVWNAIRIGVVSRCLLVC